MIGAMDLQLQGSGLLQGLQGSGLSIDYLRKGSTTHPFPISLWRNGP